MEDPEGAVENGAAIGAPSAKTMPFVLEVVDKGNTAKVGNQASKSQYPLANYHIKLMNCLSWLGRNNYWKLNEYLYF